MKSQEKIEGRVYRSRDSARESQLAKRLVEKVEDQYLFLGKEGVKTLIEAMEILARVSLEKKVEESSDGQIFEGLKKDAGFNLNMAKPMSQMEDIDEIPRLQAEIFDVCCKILEKTHKQVPQNWREPLTTLTAVQTILGDPTTDDSQQKSYKSSLLNLTFLVKG
jgi:hypothetical protein